MSFLSEVGRFFANGSNWSGSGGILVRLGMQVELSAAVLAAAALVGVLGGFVLGHVGKGGFVAVNSANAARAVPSLALLTLLAIFQPIGLNGGGFPTAFLTLFALAVPPILTNSYVGMREVDPEVREAAIAVGLSGWQRFWKTEVPLALPLAVAGMRTAAIEVVATSTLAAYVTYNDLGSYIFAGLAQNLPAEAFAGALCVAVLAGAADLFLLGCYRLVTPAAIRPRASRRALRSAGPRGRSGLLRAGS